MRIPATTLFLTLPGLMASGQSAKDIKANKIKSVTTWQKDQGDKPSEAHKDSYEVFDKYGKTTLKVIYEKDGSVKIKKTCRYDNNQNKIEDFDYAENGEVVLHKIYGYNAFQKKTEEKEYSSSGELVHKTSIAYNLAGDRTSETVNESKSYTVKKVEYKHNSRGLKTEKTTTGKTNQLEGVKKWTYE